METWATFSIVDHRQPIYRQALALFDRIVVPIPSAPIGDQTTEELDQLTSEIEFLAKHGAAKIYPWDSNEFLEWRQVSAAIAATINQDPLMDTRMMIARKLSSEDVQAVPVFGGAAAFDDSRRGLYEVEEALTVELLQRLPVPHYDSSLEDLLRLREMPAFRSSLSDLLEWKRTQVLCISNEKDRKAGIANALRQFDEYTKRYAEVMQSEGYRKLGTVSSIFFSLCVGEFVGALKEGAVSFKEVREPCWKKVSELKCSPGGVVYHFQEALQ
jgi:hypothetical protein